MKKEKGGVFQWLIKSDPNVSAAALALANVLQAASMKLAVFLKSQLLNVSIAVHAQGLALLAQLSPNNSYLEKVSHRVHFFYSCKQCAIK